MGLTNRSPSCERLVNRSQLGKTPGACAECNWPAGCFEYYRAELPWIVDAPIFLHQILSVGSAIWNMQESIARYFPSTQWYLGTEAALPETIISENI